MKGTEKQVQWAEAIKVKFNEAINTLLVGALDADTPQAQMLRNTIERINNAPANWWIDVVTDKGTDAQSVGQLLRDVATNKAYAIEGID